MARYKTDENIRECPRCELIFAEREMVIEGSINRLNLHYSVDRCPRCNWNQQLAAQVGDWEVAPDQAAY